MIAFKDYVINEYKAENCASTSFKFSHSLKPSIDKKTNKAKNSSKVLMHKASLYMRMHFRDNLSLDDIASYVNLNSSYFCKIFHSEMGTSPKQYLSALRLEYAKKLLSITDLPVIEICFACGYNSLSNFLKAFKQKYGFSPKCIRSRE